MSRAALGLLALAVCYPTSAADPKVPDTDFVIRGATIHDGTGKPGYKGDVHVKGDRIVAVGKVGDAGRREGHRRRRPGRLPRVHRPAHPLRRPV